MEEEDKKIIDVQSEQELTTEEIVPEETLKQEEVIEEIKELVQEEPSAIVSGNYEEQLSREQLLEVNLAQRIEIRDLTKKIQLIEDKLETEKELVVQQKQINKELRAEKLKMESDTTRVPVTDDMKELWSSRATYKTDVDNEYKYNKLMDVVDRTFPKKIIVQQNKQNNTVSVQRRFG